MFDRSFKRVLGQISDPSKIVIAGAGTVGRELAGAFIDHDIYPKCFMDNAVSLCGLNVYGVPVKQFTYIDADTYYVISVADDMIREAIKDQLIAIGVQNDKIICYFPFRCNAYHRELKSEEYNDEISALFKERMGYRPHLDSPQTYSEIINWEKLYVYDNHRTELADKVKAKEWVKNILGEDHVTKTYGVWGNGKEINFESLPNRFVLKANNGSGRNIIIDNKDTLDREKTIRMLDYWLSLNFAYNSFEMQYRDIEPMILAEEYLEGLATTVYDYNIFCFHGEPEYIWCIKGSHRLGCTASFYDKNWNMQPFSYGYPLDIKPAPKPRGLDEMLELSRILSSGFEHVRVDWYNMPDGRVLFGEMTFSTWGGLASFIPQKYDHHFGRLIHGNVNQK